MDEKMHFMTEPEELLNWMKEHEEFKVMNKEDAQILLNYMEGHDYRLGTDKDGSLVRVDINTDEYEAEQYSLDDVIDIVCEWNDELIRYTSQELNELSQGQDKSSLEVKKIGNDRGYRRGKKFPYARSKLCDNNGNEHIYSVYASYIGYGSAR